MIGTIWGRLCSRIKAELPHRFVQCFDQVMNSVQLLKLVFSLDEVKENEGFCIIPLNIRSLLSKIELVKLALLDGAIEVVDLSET